MKKNNTKKTTFMMHENDMSFMYFFERNLYFTSTKRNKEEEWPPPGPKALLTLTPTKTPQIKGYTQVTIPFIRGLQESKPPGPKTTINH